jgi:hypothetical protein
MKNEDANVALIRHVIRTMDEFLYDHKPEGFTEVSQLQRAFALFLLANTANLYPLTPAKRNSAPYLGPCGICGSDDICEHDLAFAAAATRKESA